VFDWDKLNSQSRPDLPYIMPQIIFQYNINSLGNCPYQISGLEVDFGWGYILHPILHQLYNRHHFVPEPNSYHNIVALIDSHIQHRDDLRAAYHYDPLNIYLIVSCDYPL